MKHSTRSKRIRQRPMTKKIRRHQDQPLLWPDRVGPVFANRQVRVQLQQRGKITPYGGVALARTGWRRDRVIHVGDSLHSDVGGAIAAGIRSGWVNRTNRIHDIGNHQPDHEFADLLGLTALVGPR